VLSKRAHMPAARLGRRAAAASGLRRMLASIEPRGFATGVNAL
jgi:hypothetical protein